MPGKFRWRGAEIAAKAEAAAMLAVDRTMAECVAEAKRNHGFQNQTGTLEGSIRIVDFAVPAPRRVFGRWGSADVAYAAYVELGTVKMAARPFLRPAADVQYPLLRVRVRQAFRGQSLS